MATDPETRKAIAQRVIDHARARGAPIDTNPTFIALLDEWVRGDIDFEEMRQRHSVLLKQQAVERRGRRMRLDETVVDDTLPHLPSDDLKEKKGHE